MPCHWCSSTGGECGCGEGHCVHCGGSGNVTPPPFGDGSTAKISQATVSYIAQAATDMRCIGEEGMIQGTAHKAARINLPSEDVEKFKAYWQDSYRDATLGDIIKQIAERAEQLAEFH